MLRRRMLDGRNAPGRRARSERPRVGARGTPRGLGLELIALAGLVLLAAGTATADILPDTGFRQLGVQAGGGPGDGLGDTSLDPLDESVSATRTSEGVFCPVLTWTADADQISSITSSTVQAAGSVSISTPPAGCSQGGTTAASSSAAFRFATDETHEFVLTGSSQNAHVRLAAFSGSLGTIYFERLATDPGGAISFSMTLPPGGYSFLVAAEANAEGPFSSGGFDVQLDVGSGPAPVPGLGGGAALLLAALLITIGAFAATRLREA